MKKQIVVLAALLLAACGPVTPLQTAKTTEPPPVSSPSTDTPAAVSEETLESAPDESAAAFPTPNPNPECVVEPITEDPNIPPTTADDWSKGADDALVTFIEYADFQ